MINSSNLIYKAHHVGAPEVESSINLDHNCKVYTKLTSEAYIWERPGI